jgi:branched-chain amino acid aminotransferase
MKETLVWFKGSIVPLSQATINILSPSNQFGANVFEGLRGYWNEKLEQMFIFRLDEHTNRLMNSVKMMRFDSQFSESDLRESVLATVKANSFTEDIACRQTIFLDGFGSWGSTGPVDMFITPIEKGRQYSSSKLGLNACISSWERIGENSLSPKIKMGANYMNSRAGQMEAKRNGYDLAIFLNNRGTVAEGPGSCLFMVRDGKLITPPITASILESITRQTIIDLAVNDLNLVVEEREVDRTELYVADEVFMCGTAMEIVPVLNVDQIIVGTGKIGDITCSLRELYFRVVRGDLLKYMHWLTPVY